MVGAQNKILKNSFQDSFFYQGNNYSLEDAKNIYSFHKKRFFTNLNSIKNNCLDYTNNLLEQDIHKTVKRLYKAQPKSIPTLRVRGEDDKIIRICSSDSDRADALEFSVFI